MNKWFHGPTPIAAISENGIGERESESQYRAYVGRVNRSTDDEIDMACRRAVERCSDRVQSARPKGAKG